jgi:CheY-like chemotaxis protein
MAIGILIVDDQSVVRRSVAELVRDSGEDWVTTSRQLLARTANFFHSTDVRHVLREPRFFCEFAAPPFRTAASSTTPTTNVASLITRNRKDHSF